MGFASGIVSSPSAAPRKTVCKQNIERSQPAKERCAVQKSELTAATELKRNFAGKTNDNKKSTPRNDEEKQQSAVCVQYKPIEAMDP